MKYLILLLFIISSFCSFGQDDDESKYIWYKYTYGTRIDRGWFNKVLRTPTDTIYTKYGLAIKGTTLYYGDGTMWREAGSGGGTPIDTANKWVQNVYVDNDNLYRVKNGTTTFLGTLNGLSSVPTLQEVFDVENAKAQFNKNDTIATNSNDLILYDKHGGSADTTGWIKMRVGGANTLTNGTRRGAVLDVYSQYWPGIRMLYGRPGGNIAPNVSWWSKDTTSGTESNSLAIGVHEYDIDKHAFIDFHSPLTYAAVEYDGSGITVFTNNNEFIHNGKAYFGSFTNPTDLVDIQGGTTSYSSIRIRDASADPTSPTEGAFWNNDNFLKYFINSTKDTIVSWRELRTRGYLTGGTPTLQQVVDVGNSVNNNSIRLYDAGYLEFDYGNNGDALNMFDQNNTSIVFETLSTSNGVKLNFSSITGGVVKDFIFPNISSSGTLTVSNFVNSWGDGIKQTFNPDGTNSGLNVGSHTADPSSPVNGDIFYNSTANELRARINGAWVALGAGGGGTPGGLDTEVQWNNNGSFDGITNATTDGTNLTVTTPRILTGIRDQYGNEIFDFTDTESTVNFLTFANAITANNPKWTASGSDTDIGIDWLAKGAGIFRLLGNSTQAATLALYEDTDNGTNYTAFKVGVQSANLTYTLPTAYPASSGYVLSSTDAGVMSWVVQGGGGVSFGTDNQIPFTNSGGTDFDYSANFTFDGSVFAVTGTASVSTSITSPLLLGGTGTGSTLSLQSTSGVGATDAVIVKVGNNGATTAATFNTSGETLLAGLSDQGDYTLQINQTSSSYKAIILGGTGTNTGSASGGFILENYVNLTNNRQMVMRGTEGNVRIRYLLGGNTEATIEAINAAASQLDLKLGGSNVIFYVGGSNKVKMFSSGGSSFGAGVVGTDPGAGNILVEGTVQINAHLILSEIAAPSTPAAGKGVIYFKTDGKVYAKDDAGNEYDLTATGGGGALDDLSNVTITSAATGQLLRYNGSAWVNYTNTFTLSGNTVIGSSTHTVTLNTSGNTSTTLPVNGTIPSYKENAITSNATWSPTGDARDNFYDITAQAAAVTTISNPSGTAANHNTLLIRVKDDGTARALSWSGTEWRAGTNLALPTTTTLGKTMYIKFIYNSTDTKWDLVSVIDGLAFEWIYILLALLIAMIATKVETKIIQMKKLRRAA